MESLNVSCVLACVAIAVSCGGPSAGDEAVATSEPLAVAATAPLPRAEPDPAPAEPGPAQGADSTPASLDSAASRPTRDFFEGACRVGEPQRIALAPSVRGGEVALDADSRGGLLAWRSSPGEVSVIAIGADGSGVGQPVVHAVSARRGPILVQRTATHFALAVSGRCEGGHQCLQALSLDDEGRAVGERVEQRLPLAVEPLVQALGLHERAADRLRLWRAGGNGGRDSWITTFAVDATDVGARIDTRDVGMFAVDRSGFSGETYLTTAHLFDASGGELHALTGWAAATREGRELRGRSLYLGAARSEVRGLGGRVRDFVVTPERAHLLLEEPAGTFTHVVLSASPDEQAQVMERTPISPDALPDPFAQRALVQIERGTLRARDALGRALTEPVEVGAVSALAFTPGRFLLLRRAGDVAELRALTCGG